jgi:hypothetical protein
VTEEKNGNKIVFMKVNARSREVNPMGPVAVDTVALLFKPFVATFEFVSTAATSLAGFKLASAGALIPGLYY